MNINFFKNGIAATILVALLSSTAAFGQSVERIYAANSCNSIDYGNNPLTDGGSWHYNDSGDQRLDAGTANGSGDYRIVCPIVRQKIGSAAGAKFFVYVDDLFDAGSEFECTMTSRRPHNGALVSSGSRLRTPAQANTNDQVVLARSIAPSSTFGHYSLECTTNDNDPAIHSYRIKEF